MTTGNTTVPSDDEPRAPRRRFILRVPALIVAWAATNPRLVGAVALLEGTGPWVVGRGDEDLDALHFFWIRLGKSAYAGSLTGISLSRRKVRVEYGDEGIEIKNIGNDKVAVLVNGKVVTGRARLMEGDVVELRGHYVFLFTTRPVEMPASEHLTDAFPAFGEPDEDGIVGESPAVWALRAEVAAVAKTDKEHVLLLGESGSGKERVAAAIHRRSGRRGSLVGCNVTALSDGLFESALFGNIANYPTPPAPARKGLVGEADGGTLMLDELGDLPAALQHKLLRLLDEQGAYQVLGESKTRYADLRIVGATNCELSDLEHDLVPRLTLRIIVPPLRERLEDIPLLVRYIILAKAKKSPGLVERFVRRDGPRPEIAIEAAFMTALLRHIYDGNVRELTQILWRAILTAGPGDTLVWSDMLDADKDDDEEALEGGSGGDEMPVEETRALLERHEWVITRAARAKRISRHALQRLVAKYGLKRPAK